MVCSDVLKTKCFLIYLVLKEIFRSPAPVIVDRINGERGITPGAGLLNIYITTYLLNDSKSERNVKKVT
jgi:hypothetical protein